MQSDLNKVNLVSNKILFNSIKSGSLSHAYLFEVDNSLEIDDFVFLFVKEILCPNKNYLTNCNKCNICNMINKSNYSDLKIIEPDGLWIKKEQLLELQNQFKTKSLENNKKIYIIKQAEKMNKASANTILKFLEEPEEDIIAILLTNNIHNVIDTIVSRCQIINIKTKKEEIIKFDQEKINNVVKFIINLEKEKENVIANIDELWNNIFKEKRDQQDAFEIMLLFYMDFINYLLHNEVRWFKENIKEINILSDYNNINTVQQKIYIIDNLKDKLNFNVNSSLLIDKLIYQIIGVK